MKRESIRAENLAPAWAAALLLSIFAGGLPRAARACSPAPCIAASPNPVIVQGASQGTTTLDWNAGLVSGQLTIVVLVGSQTVGTYPVSTSGTQQLPVQVGKTYDVQLSQDRNGDKVLASVQVTVHGKINLPGPAKIGTIKNVEVIPRGTWVELKFSAPFPGKAEVWISKNPPQGNSEQGLQVVRYSSADGSYQFQHDKKIYDITPGTHFFYLIRATSHNGLRAHASGGFETLLRYVKVSIDKIKVIDDSDELSAGDLSFSYHLNGGAGHPGGATLLGPGGGALDQGVSVDSGQTINVNKTFEVQTALDKVKLNNTGFDEDGFATQGVAFLGPKCQWDKPFDGSYSDDACDRSGATKTFSGLGPQGPGLETFKLADFRHDVLGAKLKFRVYGRIWVYYR
jgi:hypothetical protein